MAKRRRGRDEMPVLRALPSSFPRRRESIRPAACEEVDAASPPGLPFCQKSDVFIWLRQFFKLVWAALLSYRRMERRRAFLKEDAMPDGIRLIVVAFRLLAKEQLHSPMQEMYLLARKSCSKTEQIKRKTAAAVFGGGLG